LGYEQIVLPGFVVMELLQGCRNKVEQAKTQKTLKRYDIAWPSPDTCEAALAVFAQFHLSHGIGIIDALIGQMAVALDVPLYTFNQKHYAAIPDLKIVQPYSQRTP